MSLCDPIADMLTRIRNAHMASRDTVEMPHSKLKGEVTRVFKREGFINDYVVEGGTKKMLRIFLKYSDDRIPAVRGIKRESKQGLRKHVPASDIPRVLGGLGVMVLTTSSGVMTGKEAKELGVGGELLCSIW